MKEERNEKKMRSSHFFYYLALGLVVIAVVLGVVFWLKGETRTYGEYPSSEPSSSLVCESIGYNYPFFTYNYARKNTLQINVSLDKNELKTISLAYTLNYDSADEIDKSEAKNHAAMNKQFAEDELGHDQFGSNYAKLSDGVKYTIVADADEVYNKGGAKYFLLSEAGDPPFSSDAIVKAYRQKGIKCEKNN